MIEAQPRYVESTLIDSSLSLISEKRVASQDFISLSMIIFGGLP